MDMDKRNENNLEERKRKELEHSDRRRTIVKAYEYFTDASKENKKDRYVGSVEEYGSNFSNMKFYSITRSSMAYRDSILFNNIANSTVLDYCCGNGEVAIEMAKRGAKKIIGIDISSVAVENATALAADENVSDRCEFLVMDAERTEFENDTFDLIHEYGALHHLDLGAAYSELSRIIKPDGRLICTETMRHNPLIHWYRKKTPNLRTEWEVEHILGIPEIEQGGAFFSGVNYKMFHLAALAAVPLRKSRLFGSVLGILERIDNFVLSIPGVQKMAWISVVEFSKPLRSVQQK